MCQKIISIHDVQITSIFIYNIMLESLFIIPYWVYLPRTFIPKHEHLKAQLHDSTSHSNFIQKP